MVLIKMTHATQIHPHKKIKPLNSAKRITETVGETEWKTALEEKDREGNGKY